MEVIMKLLLSIDMKNYKADGTVMERPSSRGVFIKDHKIAMIHSLEYDYYKFPGGGIKKGESQIDALIREVKEEAGLIVIPDSIKEYGYVHIVEKGEKEDVFVQDNYYYVINCEEKTLPPELDEYEKEEKFTLEFVLPTYAMAVNMKCVNDLKKMMMIDRENRVLALLLKDHYFD